MYTTKTRPLVPGLATFLILSALTFSPSGGAIGQPPQAACSGDPCADTKCYTTEASAHAYGSEDAWTDAHTATTSDADHTSNGGVHSRAVGAPTTWANAHGKEDWSLEDAKSSCSNGGGSTISASGAEIDIGVVGCTADERITQDFAFQGRLFLAGTTIVAQDVNGGTLAFPGGEILMDGDTPAQRSALSAEGMLALPLSLEVVMSSSPTGSACSVSRVGE